MIEHVLATRFAVAGGDTKFRLPSLAWIAQRFDLFERWCLPSVIAQTERRFTWRLLAHPDLVPQVADRLQGYDARIRVCAQDAPLEAAADTTLHLTSRLDSDDVIAPTYLATIRAAVDQHAASSRTYLLNARAGYRVDATTGEAHPHDMRHGPFLTLVQSARTPLRDVYAWSHTRAHTQLPEYPLGAARLWVQMCHGGNVKNRLQATPRVPVATVSAAMGVAL